jgi:hypothetical protein
MGAAPSPRSTAVSEQFLAINSDHDEAYRLLSTVSESSNPFIRADQAGSSDNSQREVVRKRTRASYAQLFAITKIRDNIEFPVKDRRLYNVLIAGLAALAALMVLFRLVDLSTSVRCIILDAIAIVGTYVAVGLWIGSSHVRTAAALPLRAVLSVFGYCREWFAAQCNVWLARIGPHVAWSYSQARTLGFVGAPYRLDEVKVSREPSEIHYAAFVCEDLRPGMLQRAQRRRDRILSTNIGLTLQTLGDPTSSLDGFKNIGERFGRANLIHSCYYHHMNKDFIRHMALWIAQSPQVRILGAFGPEERAEDEFGNPEE